MRKNKRTFFTTALGVIILLVGGYYAFNQPPSMEYLEAHPEAFRFERYKNKKSIELALNHVFKVRTNQKDIEEILVGRAGAKSEGTTLYSNGFHIYRYRPWHLSLYEAVMFANCSDYVVKACYRNEKIVSFEAITPCINNTVGSRDQKSCDVKK